MERFKRGSEWRRWDLHIHTPETQKNDNFNGLTTEEKWDNFYNTINDYIGDGTEPTRNIAVIGITDYLSIDNYIKVVKDKRLPEAVKLVLPNIELRLSSMGKNSPVNIHCIFNPEIVGELENRFFAKLIFNDGTRSYNATKSELKALGKSIEEDCDDIRAYRLGLSRFLIDVKDLRKLFEDDKGLRRNTIIVVPNACGDGASGVTTKESQNDALKNSIYKLADMIFSSNSMDRLFFLGQKESVSAEKVIHDCGSLKPCIHGSDAHDLNKLFNPDKQRYCWIKADPTFNGLKQIIYEPEARVMISSSMPETKANYQVIKSVSINNPLFSKEDIQFNDKLNCIIGGKSTGKSLLLRSIAFSIDRKQCVDKLNICATKFEPLNGVSVNWADGSISSVAKNDEKDNAHKILYIPQTYLNRLTDQEQEKTEIDSIIKEVLLQNVIFAEKDREISLLLTKTNKLLSQKIYDLIDYYNQIVEIKNILKEYGSRSGMKNEIKKLVDEKNRLSSSSTMTDKEITLYDSKIQKLKNNNNSIFQIINTRKRLQLLDSLVIAAEVSYLENEPIYSRILEIQKKALNEADIVWVKEKEKIFASLDKRIQELQKENKDIEEFIKPLAEKMKKNESLLKITQKLGEQKSLLEAFRNKETELNLAKKKYLNLKQELLKTLFYCKDIHDMYLDFPFSDANNSDLKFSIDTVLKSDKWKAFIKEHTDNRTLKAICSSNDIDIEEINEISFTKELIDKLIDLCLNDELRLTKNSSKEKFLHGLLQDWYESLYRITMDEDSIKDMSPGKKAIVLLKLLIQMADSKCPVLIDQPEDDLDNRSIYKDLIFFIKKKKIDRQFIIVTHNANVVVGGDAEEIIVSNRDGAKTPNENYKFEYLTGSIENDEPINEKSTFVLPKKSIQGHICEIMEGGQEAFNLRKQKYNIR